LRLKSVSNPQNRFSSYSYDWLDVPELGAVEIYEEQAKSILSKNNSPDLGFEYSVNPYRGCFHGCAYCYARPSHQYLDFGAGTDFERKLIVKVNAPELLEAAFWKKSWSGANIVFSGNTDCYQPLEANYELTRKCLEVCAKFCNPVSIITKGVLIERDVELLAELAKVTSVHVTMSIAFFDDEISKLLEPGAPRPSRRFRAMQMLADNGISVGLSLSPVIPGLNDADIPRILEMSSAAGAKTAFMTLIRLPGEVESVFIERLTTQLGAKANKVLSAIKAMKGGVLNRSEFGKRMRGNGQRWDAVQWLFESSCERLGINVCDERSLSESVMRQKQNSSFTRPSIKPKPGKTQQQLKLF